jgi:hypothetical protein
MQIPINKINSNPIMIMEYYRKCKAVKGEIINNDANNHLEIRKILNRRLRNIILLLSILKYY